MLNINIWGIDPNLNKEVLSDLRERLTIVAMANRRWGLSRSQISIRFPLERLGEFSHVFIQVESTPGTSAGEMIWSNLVDVMTQKIFDIIFNLLEKTSTSVLLRFTFTATNGTTLAKFVCKDGQNQIDEQST